MFKRLAKFRPLEAWRIVPGTGAATYSNDNRPGLRRPARARPNRPLACHWVLIDGHLECRWDFEAPDGAPIGDFESLPKAGRMVGPPSTSRTLASRRADHPTLRAAG